MIFKSQEEPLSQLKMLAKSGRHSILIEGPKGCGKSYLANQYANMLEIDDFMQVVPKVADIREAIESCMQITNDIVICIENLDLGVAGASYTLLKFLEEPAPNVYIVVTCRNIQQVPDTIVSRSTVVTVGPPIRSDLETYASNKNFSAFHIIENKLVWRCTQSISDVDCVLEMNPTQVAYYESLANLFQSNESVSSIVWSIGHYADGKETNVEIAIRCIMEVLKTNFVTKCGIDCMKDIASGRVAPHAVLSKFAFNVKYCE